jgi:maleylacetoacetate isomerase
MSIVLYDYWRSSASYRVRIALNLKQVPYEALAVSLIEGEQRADENRARNPQGFVPTLEVDGAPLTQSLAIIEWIDQTYPDPPLLPAHPIARAAAWARALIVACDIHPVDNLRVLKRLETQFGADQAAKNDWYRHWVIEGLDSLEALAGEGPFLGGETPDLSDLCLVPQLYNARRFDVPLDRYPRLLRADEAAAGLEAFAAAHPDRITH